MKTAFITLSFILASFTSTFANDTLESPLAVTAFQSTYTKATDVNWYQVGEFYKINFALDGKASTAFYKGDGTLVAFTQNMSSSELPAGLKKSLKKSLSGKWITDLFQMENEGGTSYFVCLENADEKVVLQSSGTKKWKVYSKETKL